MQFLRCSFLLVALLFFWGESVFAKGGDLTTQTRPNILYIMTDDHAAHALSCYGSKVNKTPNLDRIAEEGMRLTNCFATNALCAPSRATILTGKYSHLTGVRTHQSPPFDNSQMSYPKLLKQAGYQTAVVGKWHLKSNPSDGMFDYWNILPGQGAYHNPRFIDMGTTRTIKGYVTDIVSDLSIEFLKKRDPKKPFLLLSHHKAPHRPWEPDAKHANMYEETSIPLPANYFDDYKNRATPAEKALMRVARDMNFVDLKSTPPAELSGRARDEWFYQRYMEDYLRCVASVDDNVGRLLDYMRDNGLMENTIIIYTSDQGFFLGDHGWYDKRFMYEESLHMPFLVRYPKEIKPASTSDAFVINADFAPTLLDYAGVKAPGEMQGKSFRTILAGNNPADWRKSMYYHFFEHMDVDHKVARHYGVRTDRYKLIHYYHPMDEWELFDLQKDPKEMKSVYADPEYAATLIELQEELQRLRKQYQDPPDDGSVK